MTETAAGDSGPVFRLIYRSRSRVGAAERKHQLGEIFSVARSSNKKLGVTGALLITDDEFVQTLEGAEPVVRELYAKIRTSGTSISNCWTAGMSQNACSAGGPWPRWLRRVSRTSRC
jgi:hypothetical protein